MSRERLADGTLRSAAETLREPAVTRARRVTSVFSGQSAGSSSE